MFSYSEFWIDIIHLIKGQQIINHKQNIMEFQPKYFWSQFLCFIQYAVQSFVSDFELSLSHRLDSNSSTD